MAICLSKPTGTDNALYENPLRVTGKLDVEVFGPDGQLKDARYINNLVVTAGKGHIASILQLATASTIAVTGSENGTGNVVRLISGAHGQSTGQQVAVSGTGGTVEANGLWTITNYSTTKMELTGTTFANAWTSGGTIYPVRMMAWMGIGTGTSAAAAGDTALGTEITSGLATTNNTITPATATRVSAVRTNPSAPVVQYVSTWAAGVATNGALTEAGIFDSSLTTGGTLLARSVFAAIAKAAADTLTITWQVTIS